MINAVCKAMDNGTPYLASSFWISQSVEDLCKELISSTDGQMARVYLTGSGSEAMEAALKAARQFFFMNRMRKPLVYTSLPVRVRTMETL